MNDGCFDYNEEELRKQAAVRKDYTNQKRQWEEKRLTSAKVDRLSLV